MVNWLVDNVSFFAIGFHADYSRKKACQFPLGMPIGSNHQCMSKQ